MGKHGEVYRGYVKNFYIYTQENVQLHDGTFRTVNVAQAFLASSSPPNAHLGVNVFPPLPLSQESFAVNVVHQLFRSGPRSLNRPDCPSAYPPSPYLCAYNIQCLSASPGKIVMVREK